jgi:2-polyprenyl-6-hydroxyphenyl methylase/3-demethylubiquinone-9 3-methyltransferase
VRSGAAFLDRFGAALAVDVGLGERHECAPLAPQRSPQSQEHNVRGVEVQEIPERDGDARYGFGDNWKKYLSLLDDRRIEQAERSLSEMLGRRRFDGLTWLDVGSGSGLFSLAARRLGARVVSFDFDPSSVWCTAELRRRYYRNDTDWTVLQGSVLDPEFMAALPDFDVVYSWGVLHHTGQMHRAIANAAHRVRPGGSFYVALYRKTIFCPAWRAEKRLYSRAPEGVRALLRAAWIGKTRLSFFVKRRDFEAMVAEYGEAGGRGMDYERDVDDWMGGYPYESITPRECRDLMRDLGFSLVTERALTQGISFATSSGCDEWVFRREPGGGRG